METVKIKIERRPGLISLASCHVKIFGETKLFTYYEYDGKDRKLAPYGNEIYKGRNYVYFSKSKSYSRHFPLGKERPKKYDPIFNTLQRVFGEVKAWEFNHPQDIKREYEIILPIPENFFN
jgi:hypothetical protein